MIFWMSCSQADIPNTKFIILVHLQESYTHKLQSPKFYQLTQLPDSLSSKKIKHKPHQILRKTITKSCNMFPPYLLDDFPAILLMKKIQKEK